MRTEFNFPQSHNNKDRSNLNFLPPLFNECEAFQSSSRMSDRKNVDFYFFNFPTDFLTVPPRLSSPLSCSTLFNENRVVSCIYNRTAQALQHRRLILSGFFLLFTRFMIKEMNFLIPNTFASETTTMRMRFLPTFFNGNWLMCKIVTFQQKNEINFIHWINFCAC